MRAPGRGRGADRHRRRGEPDAQRARRQGGRSARHLPLRQGVRLGRRRHRAWPHRSVAALDRRDAGARRREGVRARRRPLEGDEGPAVVRVMDAPTASRPAVNPLVADTGTPPIPEAQGWVQRYGGAHGPLINMSQAVPGHPPHPDFMARLVEAAASVDAGRYGPIAGDADLRAAYAGHLAALSGGDIAAADVAITAGCNMGFVAALMLVAKAGDNILLPSPWYFNHEMTAGMLGIAARPLPCDPKAGFVPDPDEAGRLIDARIRAIVLVTPNNPTGAIYPEHVIGAFADLCRRRGLWLVLDETYRDFLPPSHGRAHGLFADGAWRERVIELYSFSKAYCIAGHRALAWGIGALSAWRDENRREMHRRAETFRRALGQSQEWQVDSIGAYF